MNRSYGGNYAGLAGFGNYGAGYIPTGVMASPGLYNQAAWDAHWLPSWANLEGGILGPLYTPSITDPAAVAAIKAGSWDFSTAGSAFDPQGNFDLMPDGSTIPNHYYSGRSMTLHGYGQDGGAYAGPMEMVRGAVGAVGGLLEKWKSWVLGLGTVGKVVYWAAVAAVAVAVLGRTKLGSMLKMSKWPVIGSLAGKAAPGKFFSVAALGGSRSRSKRASYKTRSNPRRAKKRSNPRVRKYKPWGKYHGKPKQARFKDASYRARHNRRRARK